jgi:hypothetical protein
MLVLADMMAQKVPMAHKVLLVLLVLLAQKAIQDVMPQCTFKQLLLTIVLGPPVIFGINSNHGN